MPLIWSTAYFMNTLCRTMASVQRFGGCARAAMTTGSFHWMPPAGFECSCARPMAWPNSCPAVPPSRKPRFIVASFAGMPLLSVPTYDHAPSLGSKLMRMSAAMCDPKSNEMLHVCCHQAAC